MQTLKTLLFRCPPGGQFHFGKIALDDKTSLNDSSHTFHSDTLASAILATGYRVLHASKADQVRHWFKEAKVCFSSLFFCLENTVGQEHRHVFFLPKPVNLEIGPYHEPKTVRKVKGISKKAWEAGAMWENRKNGNQKNTVLPDGYLTLDGKFVVSQKELEELGCPHLSEKFKLYDTDAVTKVKIHQPVREDNLYFHGNIFLPTPGPAEPRVHFFALVRHELEDSQWDTVFSILQILADEGIGGERSVGCGRLLGVQDLGVFQLELDDASDRCVTLSLVSPADEEDLSRLLAWKTVTRGGRFVSAKQNLLRLKMVAEGALATKGLKGRYHDISNHTDHTHLRFGHALCLPLPPNYANHGEF